MLSTGLFVVKEIAPDVVVMDFKGRLTTPGIMVASVEQTIKRRIEGGARKLVLDLTKVDFVDSSGIGMLMVCWSSMNKAGGKLVIAGAAGYAKEVLNMVHLERHVGMYSDLAEACKAMTEPGPPPA